MKFSALPGALPALFIPIAVVLTSCSKPQGEGANLRIRFPSEDAASYQGPKAAAVPLANLCFAVNVTGEGITPANSGKCDLTRGIVAGSVPPGGEVSLAVPRGQARKLEVFAYQRASSSDPCPNVESGFAKLDAKKISRVGEVSSFATIDPEVTVSVTIALPDGSSNLITQYGLPSSCGTSVKTVTGPSAPMFSSPLKTSAATGGYTVRSAVGAPLGNHATTAAGGWKVKLYMKGDSQ